MEHKHRRFEYSLNFPLSVILCLFLLFLSHLCSFCLIILIFMFLPWNAWTPLRLYPDRWCPDVCLQQMAPGLWTWQTSLKLGYTQITYRHAARVQEKQTLRTPQMKKTPQEKDTNRSKKEVRTRIKYKAEVWWIWGVKLHVTIVPWQRKSRQLSLALLGYSLIARGAGIEQK